jgi:probable F420-dependent oxidoreductase
MIKLSIVTPVLSLFPGRHAAWERHATIDDVRRIAEAADRFGYDCMTCSEHIVIPADNTENRGPSYWDPLPTFGYLAAHTSRIRLTTLVLVLPYHHPLDIAKRYGTLDRICGGRLVLGVGTGYLQPEFEVLGAPFEDRGARTDDAIRAIRASFGRPEPAYDGPYYRFSGMVVDPCGLQQPPPIWVGGRSRRSLRRAVELADAWAPYNVTPSDVKQWLAAASETEAWKRREAPLDVTYGSDRLLDPVGDPDAALASARELQDGGATMLSLRFRHESVEHYIDQLEAMVQVAAKV